MEKQMNLRLGSISRNLFSNSAQEIHPNKSQIELSRYGDGSINPKVFERVWTLRRYLEVPDKMDYRDFVWFILAEEDKTDPTSIEYWFYILDQVNYTVYES